eukprot:Gregarina_sp_Poly_1__2462@NODE_1668_length_3572_cov_193_780884_g1095_i0_p2_GENE_NODE_1668_length_3572_cov_193_780884_g1095_i0NODE_1668_length_3572_cov_193_780884_g1095_i0_p2_ORF_typecomplete_len308_score27_43DSPc/PF00782_20/1_2e07Y_phosphatase3/PF13350_6/7_7e03Y_phosphatase3/PF13350_6/0_0027Y_phosphatase/PF00102_27/0_0039Y_phosphatase2/PF03162_13/0_037CDKN3/PF05706_12/4_6e02CDKN3/PF05706_12/0_39PTPlike_phytase/PF14566_6/0_067_NODE_1668_length_3572_cov_193_780884_g1095_i04171340
MAGRTANILLENNQSSRRLPGGPFPEGWEFFRPALHVCWLVRQIGPNRFSLLGICPCKTPLDERFDSRRRQVREAALRSYVQLVPSVSDEERTVMERLRQTSDRYCGAWHPLDIPWCLGDSWESGCDVPANVKAVVNLCATERYYNCNDFLKAGIAYVWHKIEGGGHIPTAADIVKLANLLSDLSARFAVNLDCRDFEEVEMLTQKNPTKFPVILLHCTHGVNRTGFTTAAFALLHDKTLKVEEAANLFGTIRGHYINRSDLVSALSDLFEKFPNDENETSHGPCPSLRRGDGKIFPRPPVRVHSSC